MIYHVKTPKFPQFRFEWHEDKKTVYFIRVGVVPEVGEIVMENVVTQGAAQMAVLCWLRGYHEASIKTLGQR